MERVYIIQIYFPLTSILKHGGNICNTNLSPYIHTIKLCRGGWTAAIFKSWKPLKVRTTVWTYYKVRTQSLIIVITESLAGLVMWIISQLINPFVYLCYNS